LLDFTNEVLNDVDAEDLMKETLQDQKGDDVEDTKNLRSGGWRYRRQGANTYNASIRYRQYTR